MIDISFGTITLGDKVDITDPCYKKDTWCRINDIPVVPGEYLCKAKRILTGGAYMDAKNYVLFPEDYSDSRIAEITIIKKDYEELSDELFDWDELGFIGVDAGLAGFFANKPDFSDLEWEEFCGDMDEQDREKITLVGREYTYGLYLDSQNFFSLSGYGDGRYDVLGLKEGDKYVGLKIIFIWEEDEE